MGRKIDWISVEERNPEPRETVMVRVEISFLAAYRDEHGEWIINGPMLKRASHITHWHPLPEFPGEDKGARIKDFR